MNKITTVFVVILPTGNITYFGTPVTHTKKKEAILSPPPPDPQKDNPTSSLNQKLCLFPVLTTSTRGYWCHTIPEM